MLKYEANKTSFSAIYNDLCHPQATLFSKFRVTFPVFRNGEAMNLKLGKQM